MAKQKRKTGMSQRVSFLDRSVVAENNAILRFNEDLERAARREQAIQAGEPLPVDPPAGRRDRPVRSGGRGRPGADRGDAGARPAPRRDRPAAPAREPRPGEPELVAAAEAAEGFADFKVPAKRMVELLLRGRKAGTATTLAWNDVAAKQAPDVDWDDVRARWAVVRDAVLAQWFVQHPDQAPPPPAPKKKRTPRKRAKKKTVPSPADLDPSNFAGTDPVPAGDDVQEPQGSGDAPDLGPQSSGDIPDVEPHSSEETSASEATSELREPRAAEVGEGDAAPGHGEDQGEQRTADDGPVAG